MNTLTIVVIAITGICALRGWIEGFVKTTFRFVLNLAVLACSYYLTPILVKSIFRQLLTDRSSAMEQVRLLLIVFLFLKFGARAIVASLDLIAKLPVLKTMNKLLGLVTGILQGLLFVCILFMLSTAFSGTQFGIWVDEMSRESEWLRMLYESNLLRRALEEYVLHGSLLS